MPSPPLDLLACPACQGQLKAAETVLVCEGCARAFLVYDDVPDLRLSPPCDSRQAPPGPVGRALKTIVSTPAVYDTVQRLAGAAVVFERLRSVLAEADGGVVLDAGAGTGRLREALPRSSRYLWLDTDRRKLAGFAAKSDAAILGDATRIPLKDDSVDWAVSVGVSHHLDDDELGQMLAELARVARRRVVFLDAVVTPSLKSRGLWRYDRGRHPRRADDLKSALAVRLEVLDEQEFSTIHRYVLIRARPLHAARDDQKRAPSGEREAPGDQTSLGRHSRSEERLDDAM
jgi:SAM-dependent methyltransferase